MDLDDLSYLHVLKADETEDVTKRLSKILQEAAENNSPDVDTLWKIITHLWNKIYFLPHRNPITPLEQIPGLDSILSPEDIRTQKYASFIQIVYSWLSLHHQTNTDGQALSDIGRYKPGLDEETVNRWEEGKRRAKNNQDGSTQEQTSDRGRFIHSMAHYFLIKGVFKRCAERGEPLETAMDRWNRAEEERKKREEEERGGTEGTGEREELKSEKGE